MHAKHANSDRLNDLSGRVIGCTFTVLNTLGVRFLDEGGFPEKVDENVVAIELRASVYSVS